MPKFLNTSAINYHLEEMIKGARERLILVSPYLKLNDRIKELLEDKNRLKIDVRMVYGKTELAPAEADWLGNLRFVRTSFCKNLHAKCYLNEEECIVTSLNLHEFSQVNNNEMGVFVSRADDGVLYRDAYEEAQRLIRISDEVRISVERIESKDGRGHDARLAHAAQPYAKLTTGKLAANHGLMTKDLLERFVSWGLVEDRAGRHYLTGKGKQCGGEWRPGANGGFFLWPTDMPIPG